MKIIPQPKFLILTILLVSSISYLSLAQKSTPSITKIFDMNRPGSLDVTSSGGGIKVINHNRNEVEIQAYIRKKGKLLSPSDPFLSDLSDYLEIVMEKSGSNITVYADRKIKSRSWQQVGVSFTVLVPYEMSCKLVSHGGGINVSKVSGTHEFESHGGGIRIESVAGTTNVTSSGGGVKASNQEGDIRIKSSGGGISLTESKGKVYARSSGGGVKLENIQGYVEASSSGGSVRITGSSESVKAESSGGSIRMDITSLSKEVNLRSSGGGIDAVIRNGEDLGLDLDLKSQHVNIELNNFSGRSEKTRVEGSANGGGIPVYMRASGGSINLRFD